MNSIKSILESHERKEQLLPALRLFLKQERSQAEGAGGSAHRETVVADAKMTIDCFKERLSKYEGEDAKTARKAKEYFHPSQAAACMRQLWFARRNAPINKSSSGTDLLREHLIFETGTYIHVMFQNLCERAGLLEQREVMVCDDDQRIIGHADGIVKVPAENGKSIRSLLEIKTINARGFTSLRGPHESHRRQVTIYMKLLGLTQTNIVYLNKDKHEAREFVIPFDDKFYRKTVLPRIQTYFEVIKQDTPPDKEGFNPNSMPCLFCSFSRVCFDTFELNRFLKSLAAGKPSVKPVKKLRFSFKKP